MDFYHLLPGAGLKRSQFCCQHIYNTAALYPSLSTSVDASPKPSS